MVFTSNVFLFLFLPVFLLVYYAVKDSWRSYVIVLGSYLFYAWWRPDFLLLFVAISYWNYWFGLLIKRRIDADDKKSAFRLLCLGVAGDLAALGYFKYANFGVEVIAAALAPLGVTRGRDRAGGGADIGALVAAGVPAIDLQQDGTRYFDWHHTPDDTLDKVDPAQLRQNVVAWTATLSILANSSDAELP